MMKGFLSIIDWPAFSTHDIPFHYHTHLSAKGKWPLNVRGLLFQLAAFTLWMGFMSLGRILTLFK